MTEQSTPTIVGYAEPGLRSAEHDRPRLTGVMLIRIAIIAMLLCALFWPNLRRLWLKTNPVTGEANWGHSLFVPLIGLYYLYLNRQALLKPKPGSTLGMLGKGLGAWAMLQMAVWGAAFIAWAYYPSAFRGAAGWIIKGGLAAQMIGMLAFVLLAPGMRSRHGSSARRIVTAVADSSAGWFGSSTLAFGLVFYAWSIWPGQNDFLKDGSMVITLFGAVLLLCGWPVMRVAWFPILFLGVAFPWPPLIYSQIAMPLQRLAAEAAALTLQATGVDAVTTGTKLRIELGGGRGVKFLDVAEACAGLKSLMTFIAVASAVAFLSSRAMWQKIIIAASAVPIAVFCNMLRVSGQGILDVYVNEKLSQSFAHQFVGMIMLIPAFFMILGVAWILDHVFIEEVDKRLSSTQRAAEPAVIEIPRAGRRPAAQAASPAAPAVATEGNDLAAATQRLMQARRRQAKPAEGNQP